MISLGSRDDVVFMLHVNLKERGFTSVPSLTELLEKGGIKIRSRLALKLHKQIYEKDVDETHKTRAPTSKGVETDWKQNGKERARDRLREI